MCRLKRPQRQPVADMTPILDAAPHHEKACASAIPRAGGLGTLRNRTPGMARTRVSPSEHLHPGLGPEHPLLIGGQDQGLAAGHEVGLAADVPLAIEEEHPQQLAGCAQQMD